MIAAAKYEELYSKIQDTANAVYNFVGDVKMEGEIPTATEKRLAKLLDAAAELSNAAHELEEHLAWD